MTPSREQFLFWLSLPRRLPTLDRYIATELVMPFLFGVGAFSSIGLAVGALFELVQDVSEAAIPLPIALQVFLWQIPYFVGLSLPMATLLATLIAYSRFAKDREITALQGCGVSTYRLVLPAVALSLVVTGITFAWNEGLVPTTKQQVFSLLDQAVQQKSALEATNIFYPEFKDVKGQNGETDQELVRLFYAHQFDGQHMQGLTILDFSQPNFSQVVTAESATWNSAQNVWNFSNGTIYLVAPDGSSRNTLRFEQQQLQIPRALDLSEANRHSTEMSLVEAEQYLQQLRRDGDSQKTRKIAVRIQQRYALPWMCIVYGLIGATLGTWPRQASATTGFGISVLIIFGHYLLSFFTGALGHAGLLSPVLSAWLPPGFGLVTGGWLLVRVSR